MKKKKKWNSEIPYINDDCRALTQPGELPQIKKDIFVQFIR